jgi:excisionase family DNA binding protein
MEKNQITIAELSQRLDSIESLLLSNKTVLSFRECSDYTGLSYSYLYKLTSTGGIPCYKPNGKHIYFDRREIDQWLLTNRRATREEIEQAASTRVTIGKGGVK